MTSLLDVGGCHLLRVAWPPDARRSSARCFEQVSSQAHGTRAVRCTKWQTRRTRSCDRSWPAVTAVASSPDQVSRGANGFTNDAAALDLDRPLAPIHKTLDAAESTKLYALVRGLVGPVPSGFTSCPDDPSYILTLKCSSGGQTIAVATAETGHCRLVRISGDARQSDQAFWREVASAMGAAVGQITRN